MLQTIVRQYEQVPWLMQMRELARRWWGVEVIYIDKTDSPVFLSGQPSRIKNRVCAICLSNEKGAHLCHMAMVKAQAEARRMGKSGGGLLSYNCHLGQVTMVVPVSIEKRYSGSIYTTGFFDHELSRAERSELLDAGGRINPALGNEEILSSVPVLTPEHVEQLNDVLQLGAWAIVSLNAEMRAKEEEIASLKQRLERQGYAGLVGSSSVMQEVYHLVDRVAADDCTVLVRGASGTGKELVARAIHQQSHRVKGPFVVQNCSAFNDNLLESELFGHVRGSFTGAVSDKKGLFEIASGGTLFLDEVAEMSAALQAKLLRVLQDQTFWPVGATTPKSSDVRIVAATHRDLEQMVQQESFREDLYYRVNVITITLPPLRERRSDIPQLVRHFLKRRGGGLKITADAMRYLTDYDWRGNVRELANEIERMTVLAAGRKELDVDLISPRIRSSFESDGNGGGDQVPRGTLREAMEQLEARMIRSALAECSGNRSHAAKMLGIARSNLINKIKSYNIGA
jgi:transcriptional regulator with PAS, ATPase and Fis domain